MTNKGQMKLGFFLIPSLLILAVAAFSCKQKSDYPGYTKLDNGNFYKLVKIGESETKCALGDYVTADITYKTINDSIFFQGRRKFQIGKPAYPGAIDECLVMLGKEDAGSFIISAPDFFTRTLGSSPPAFLTKTGKMKFEAEIVEIQTIAQYNQEKEAFLKWTDDFGEYEKVILRQYIQGSKLNLKPIGTGIYSLLLKKGNEKTVSVGDTLVVHYEGRFLNGKFFDSTRKRNEAFQFVYGQQWQVIKGMEEAIGTMHEGERALFIFSSEMAFGDKGSSTGIIPPFTSLIFEVELISIN
jgi:FKBP-type peptidyl-prolyl cis-trans isomerase FkpA